MWGWVICGLLVYKVLTGCGDYVEFTTMNYPHFNGPAIVKQHHRIGISSHGEKVTTVSFRLRIPIALFNGSINDGRGTRREGGRGARPPAHLTCSNLPQVDCLSRSATAVPCLSLPSPPLMSLLSN